MNCCICGPVKNCGPYLKKVLANIEKICSLFDDYKIVIYYDDSNDNTLELLKEYQNHNSRLFIYINKEELSQYRTFRIAKGRNMCLSYIKENHTNFPYFIMMDMDCVNSKGKVNVEPIKKILNRDDWDAVSFNKPVYYDLWALSIKPFYLSCHHIGDSAGKKMYEYITNILQNANKDDLIPCASAFSGFAIYRTNKFVNCYYNGVLNLKLLPPKLIKQNLDLFKEKFNYNLVEDCEHRAFHFMAINKNQARIRISPEIIFPEDIPLDSVWENE